MMPCVVVEKLRKLMFTYNILLVLIPTAHHLHFQFRTLEQCCNTVHELRESYLDVYHAGSEVS